MVAFLSVVLVAVILLTVAPAQADETGAACITDGQTLSIEGRRSFGKCRGGTEIRLYGIVAPKVEDTCKAPDGRDWQCGRAAAAMLLEMTKGRTLDCEGKTRDPEGRLLATCRINGLDINQRMVRVGWALAYTRHTLRYKEDEKMAAKERRGLWQSSPQDAFEWKGR